MVKRILIIGLIVIAYGCIPTKNDYNMFRHKPARFSIKPNHNKNFIKYVATSAFYAMMLTKSHIKKYNLENVLIGVKFYDKGRIAHFRGIDFNSLESLDPKKAIMGYYNYDNKTFSIEKIYSGPALIGSTHKLSLSEIILEKSSKDTLFIRNFNRSVGSGNITKYIRMDLPKEFLIYKPDW